MISLGNIDLARASIGNTDLAAISLGNVDLWTAWTNTRADKTTTQPMDRAVWTPITWNTTTGDPIVGNAIVISGAGQATINAVVNHPSSSTNANQRDIRITINGAQAALIRSGTNTTETAIQVSAALAVGDQLRLEANPESFTAATRNINAGTFMTITA